MSKRGAARFARAALAFVVALAFAGLVATLMELPDTAPGLSERVDAALARSGIESPVTATLLDFRGYDTLLEIAVLLLTVVAARALGRGAVEPMGPDDAVLAFLGRVLLPVMILIAGYLLVAGFDAAGGAFQAGAVLAAAGVLRILSGRGVPSFEDGLAVRVGLVAGLAVFLAVGVAGIWLANAFLDFPAERAGVVVLLLETGVTVSVALALIALFLSVLRRDDADCATSEADR